MSNPILQSTEAPDPVRLIIDFNHLAYRHWAMNGELASSDGERTGTVFGVLRSIKMFCDTYRPSSVIFCRDLGRSFRRDILESYKGTRGPTSPEEERASEDRNDQFDKTVAAIECLGFPVIGVESLEADDLCAILTKRVPFDGISIVISGDKDLLQLVDDKTKYYHPHYDKLVSMTGWRPTPGEDFTFTFNRRKEVHPDSFTERTEGIPGGIPFSRWLLYRSLVGDSSDDLSGIKGIAEKTAERIVRECDSWNQVLEKKDQLKVSPRVKSELTEENLRLQYMIIDLDFVARSDAASEILPEIQRKCSPSPADIGLFRKLLMRYEMKSILADLRSFLKNFPLKIDTNC